MIIHSNRVVTSEGLKPAYIRVTNGKIEAIMDQIGDESVDFDYGNDRILPGIIDTHNHGAAGYRFDDADEDIEDDDTAVDDDTYIFPNSDTEYLTKSDLSGMSKSEINLAKNELYARHGRKFKSKELQEYFESKDWYVPKYSPKQWDKKGDTFFFNKYEIKNRDLLKKYENK